MENAAVPRPGNLQRTEWRQKYRQILSDHLSKTCSMVRDLASHRLTCSDTELGLVVELAHVHLRPNAKDKHTWAALLSTEHLFAKQLSKHSIGAFMELCREVGESFEAVAHPSLAVESFKRDHTGTSILSTFAAMSIKRYRQFLAFDGNWLCYLHLQNQATTRGD